MFSLLYGYVTGSEYGSDDESPTQAARREANTSSMYPKTSAPRSIPYSSASPIYMGGRYCDLNLESTAALIDVSNIGTPAVRTNNEGLKPLHNVQSEALSAPVSYTMPTSTDISYADESISTKINNSSSCRRRYRTVSQ